MDSNMRVRNEKMQKNIDLTLGLRIRDPDTWPEYPRLIGLLLYRHLDTWKLTFGFWFGNWEWFSRESKITRQFYWNFQGKRKIIF